jgi:hypothetical protein
MTSPRGLQVDAGLDSSSEDASSVANNFFMYIFKVRAQAACPLSERSCQHVFIFAPGLPRLAWEILLPAIQRNDQRIWAVTGCAELSLRRSPPVAFFGVCARLDDWSNVRLSCVMWDTQSSVWAVPLAGKAAWA